MRKNTALDQVSLDASGWLHIQLQKQIINDDGSVLFSEPHRMSIEPEADLGDRIAGCSAHLVELGFEAVPDEVAKQIEKIRAAHHAFAPVAAKVKAAKARRAEEETAGAAQ